MEYLTAEQIASACENLDGRANKAAINKMFREQDDSHLWPINGRFNVTERAIRKARWFQRETGVELVGLEYAYFLEEETSRIVNDPDNG
jgi:hypothetical protein